MEFKDYYKVLGVEPTAGADEIKQVYRRLARKFHPDVSKEANAEERFKAVNEAYEVLRDDAKRKSYDQLKARGFRPGEEFRPPPDFGQGAPFDVGDIFGSAGGDSAEFSDFFESLFGGRGARRRPGPGRPGPGTSGAAGRTAPQRAKLAVDLPTIHQGGSVRIEVGGRTMDVRIPAGIPQGKSIRLGGAGAGGVDLLLEIDYRPHPDYEVDGRNLVYTLSLAPWQAALGEAVKVPTLAGEVEVKVPPGSDCGRRLRLRGRGLPAHGTQPAGDQLVVIEVRAPAPASDAQRSAYENLAAAFEGGG